MIRALSILATTLTLLVTSVAGANDVPREQLSPSITTERRESGREVVNSPAAEEKEKPCSWWDRSGCGERKLAARLPEKAPKQGAVITVDAEENVLYLFKDGKLVDTAKVATGTDKVLKRGLKKWLFRTPRGKHKVLRKIVDPVWTKPDWAFIEEGKKVPPLNSPKRKVPGKLGKYALDLGDGILIHGTDDPSSLGRKASHGCIRVGDEMLEKIYQEAKVGTEVYIY